MQRFFQNEKQSLLAIALTLTCIVLLWSISALRSDGTGPKDTTWQRIQDSETLVIGVDVNFAPFGIYDDAGPQGIDPDLGRAIAEALGLNVRFVLINFDSMYDSLFTGEIDMLIAGLRYDALRTGTFRYTDSYFDAGHVLIGTPPLPHGFADIQQPLAVSFASEGDIAAQAAVDSGRANFEIVQLLSVDAVIEALANGEHTLALVDAVSAYEAQQRNPNLVLAPQPLVSDQYVMAVRRTDWELYNQLQVTLAMLDDNGQLQAILDEWLKTLALAQSIEQ